jgi:hypothetical protein
MTPRLVLPHPGVIGFVVSDGHALGPVVKRLADLFGVLVRTLADRRAPSSLAGVTCTARSLRISGAVNLAAAGGDCRVRDLPHNYA